MKINYKSLLVILLLFGVCSTVAAQQKLVNGVVKNMQGQPLRNIEVSVAGTPEVHVLTDDDGNFTIAAGKGDSLIFKSLNREKKIKVTDANTTQLRVTLPFDKVYNNGFGQEYPMKEVTSAVEAITAEDLENITAQNPENALFGQLPGLWVSQGNGPPTRRSPSFKIRGLSTLGSQNPLILVNGFERSISSLVLEEIESVKVLKDAAAKSIYGQQGANGVILVTTKSGRNTRSEYNFTLERGISTPTRTPNFVGAPAYAKAVNEARTSDGLSPRYSPGEIQLYESGQYPNLYPDVNWVDKVLGKSGAMKRFNFNTVGGSETVDYFVNLSYQGEDGFYKNTDVNSGYSSQIDYDQVNLLTNASLDLTKTTNVAVDLTAMVQNLQEPGEPDILKAAYDIPSNAFPVRNQGGSWGGTNLFDNNPVARLEDTGYNLWNKRVVYLTAQVNQDLSALINGLEATVKLGYDNGVNAHEGERKDFVYKEVIPTLDADGNITDIAEKSYGTESDLNPIRAISGLHEISSHVEARLNYKASFETSDLQAVVLFRQQGTRTDVSNHTFRWQNWAGNVHYGLHDKYFFDATLSYSGSNRIQDSKDRWGLFPAVSGAWLISGEPFLSDVNAINELKLRASWGIAGNGYIPIENTTSNQFGFPGKYNFGANNIQTPSSLRQNYLGSPLKTYESSNETNIGLDAKLFTKLSLSADIFYAKRKNILVGTAGSISNIIGINTGNRPEGVVENRGVEVAVGWDDNVGRFSYGLKGQVSFAKSKIINQNEAYQPYSYLKHEGRQIGQHFGLVSKGFFEDQADIANSPVQKFGDVKPGDIKYVDQNDDDIIDQYDKVPLGNSSFPNTYYSAALNLGYKGVGISALFQGAANRTVILNTDDIFWPMREQGNLSTWYSNYWRPNNKTNAELPRLTTQKNENNFQNNNIWKRNGSFLKLRYLEVSYELPVDLSSKIGANRVTVYARGRNMFTVDNIDYVDPENLNPVYPSVRSYNLGLKVQF